MACHCHPATFYVTFLRCDVTTDELKQFPLRQGHDLPQGGKVWTGASGGTGDSCG